MPVEHLTRNQTIVEGNFVVSAAINQLGYIPARALWEIENLFDIDKYYIFNESESINSRVLLLIVRKDEKLSASFSNLFQELFGI